MKLNHVIHLVDACTGRLYAYKAFSEQKAVIKNGEFMYELMRQRYNFTAWQEHHGISEAIASAKVRENVAFSSFISHKDSISTFFPRFTQLHSA